ncbi:polymer-forming cytoskeletal protein [Christensenella timonensis]|uniref:polymer-forming cytoskeletal protein n=1 Tax=Christensenella timonensis TaxID=1816678 RepID=UPI00082E4F5E|nr:polymer-forming cytoskeletal protein [Christensenella timonensis]
MRNGKRASTLVMVLCVFGFIVIVGVGVMTLAGVANEQASRTYGQQQADFAAQSVLDTVNGQIVDQTIDPFALGTGPTYKIEGGGSDALFGDYGIQIEKDSKSGMENVFRVAVTAEKNGFTSSMYSLLQYTSGSGGEEIGLASLFDVVAGATNLNPNASMLPSTPGSSGSEGSVFFDNGESSTTFSGGKGVTKNVDAVGPLALGAGGFGTQDGDTHIQSTGDIKITTGGTVYSTVRSEKNVVIERSQDIPGDIYADGDVTVKNGAVVQGDIHAGGTVSLEGWGAAVNGTIYANGAKKDDGTLEGGNVNIAAGALAQGDIYAGGTVTVDGNGAQSKGAIYAGGDVVVQNGAEAAKVKSNGNVLVKNDVYNGSVGSIECMGDVDLDGRFTGEVRANGKGKIAGSYSGNIYINGTVEITSITAMKELHCGATIFLNGVSTPPSSVYPSFYAPMIRAENSDISYCSLYAQGKPGTIELKNSTAYAVTEDLAPQYYAYGDVTLEDCNSLQVVKIVSNGHIVLKDSQILRDSWGGGNTLTAWGEIQVDGGKVQGNLAAGGGIEVRDAEVKANLHASREIRMKNVRAEMGIWQCNWEMDISGTFDAVGVDAFVGGNLGVRLPQQTAQGISAGFTVNGIADFENANIRGNMNVIGGGSFKNSTASGTLVFGAQPSVDNSSITGLSVVDPGTMTPVAPLGEVPWADIPSGNGDITEIKKLDIPYDEMPMVDLKLREKYENLPEWKIPAAIEAQMKQNNVYFAFNEKKPAGYEIDGNDYIFTKNCNLTLDFKKAQGQQYGKSLVFDATDSDLYIRLKMPENDGYTMEVASGVNILTKGDHNVYLFLDEGTDAGNFVDWELRGNTFMGYYDYADGVPQEGDTRVPNLYLISNAKGVAMDISRYNTAYAFFYAPQGTVKMTGSTVFSGGAKLYGSAIASHIEMGNNLRYIQYTPEGTFGSAPGGGISGWTVLGTYPGTGE